MFDVRLVSVSGRVLIAVALALAGGCGEPVAQETDAGPADSGMSCPIAAPLPLTSAPVAGRLAGDSENASTTCTASTGTNGPEHWYALEVTARMGVRITAAAPTAMPLAVAIRRTCDDPLSEIACRTPDTSPPGTPSSTMVAAVLDPGTYFVIVDVIGFGVGGDYTVTADTFEPAVNATCDTATPVTDGTSLTDQTAMSTAETTFTCPGFSPTIGPLYYSTSVPANHRLIVGTRWSSPEMPPGGPPVVVATSCDPASCVSEGTPFARHTNLTDDAQEVVIAVGPRDFPPGARSALFSVDFTMQALAPNRVCTAAAPLALGTAVTGDFTLGDPAPFTCDSTFPAPPITGTHYYSVTIPAGRTLAASATMRGGGGYSNASLALIASCGAATCLGDPAAVPAQNTLTYANTGTTPLEAILLVGPDFISESPQEFELIANILAPPTNLTCATATVVADGDRLRFENAGDATTSLAGTCEAGATGGVLFYRASVPAGETLRARVAAPWPWLLRVLDACGATECAQTIRSPGRLDYVNEGAAAADVFLAIGPAIGPSAGLFELAVDIGPTAYTATSITASCEDTAAGALVPGVVTDDSVSPETDLPFAFAFFGEAVTRYVVSSNGLAHLLDATTPAPMAVAAMNTGLPNAEEPNGLIAALWEDLVPGAARTLLAGSGSTRHLVIEWSGFSRFSAPPDSTATFQLKLFETTNVIEVHHCEIGPVFETGSATVGLEDRDGLDGVQYVFNTPGAITAGTGVRFVPGGS